MDTSQTEMDTYVIFISLVFIYAGILNGFSAFIFVTGTVDSLVSFTFSQYNLFAIYFAFTYTNTGL